MKKRRYNGFACYTRGLRYNGFACDITDLHADITVMSVLCPVGERHRHSVLVVRHRHSVLGLCALFSSFPLSSITRGKVVSRSGQRERTCAARELLWMSAVLWVRRFNFALFPLVFVAFIRI